MATGSAATVTRIERDPLMTQSEQIKWLAERWAISLMANTEIMQGIALLDSREGDRETLKDDPGYEACLRMIRRALQAEMRRVELERRRL